MRQRHSDYMNWAKTKSKARYNLATSGVGSFPLAELPDQPRLEINGNSTYGYAPLQDAIAQKCGVHPDCVVAAAGTSMANHLAMAALIESGDEVLIEKPAYELLVSTALYLGASVTRFERAEEDAFQIDPDRVRRALTSRTKLIVVTNLHNPSSVLTGEPVLREIGELARSVGAQVLVDEVYLDAVYDNTPRTAFHLGPEFIVTNSLTKVYGLSGLRCGWILANPDLARAMWRLNDLFGVIPAHPAELLSVAAFENLMTIRDRARQIVEADRAILSEFLRTQDSVSAPHTHYGTTAFLRLKGREVDPFLERLRTDCETTAVPGRFFEMPDHLRIGMGVDTAMFREGISRLARTIKS
ncbi:MAG: aminotransferase class I/II-fold pyridoxal phosphate-dependent enzyme [Bryobacteraceae bacterium]